MQQSSNLTTNLLAGPYHVPEVRLGDYLDDEIYGRVEVGGWSNGRIPWPRRKKTGKHSLILCGDLVRAVRTESALAVEYWFGVGATTIAKWRIALGVTAQNNTGTKSLYQFYKPLKLTEDRAEKGRKNARAPKAIAKMAESKRGKPAHPATKEALLKAAKKPKSIKWGIRANAKMLGKALPDMGLTRPYHWESWEDEFIKEFYRERPTKWMAIKLDRSEVAIKARAGILGARKYTKEFWKEEEDQHLIDNYLNKKSYELSKDLNRTKNAVLSRIAHLKLNEKIKTNIIRPKTIFSADEDNFIAINYKHDRTEAIAKKLNCPVSSIYYRAAQLGVSAPREHKKPWTAEDDAFLILHYRVLPTRDIAEKCNRPASEIYSRAAQLGLGIKNSRGRKGHEQQ